MANINPSVKKTGPNDGYLPVWIIGGEAKHEKQMKAEYRYRVGDYLNVLIDNEPTIVIVVNSIPMDATSFCAYLPSGEELNIAPNDVKPFTEEQERIMTGWFIFHAFGGA